MSKQHKRNKPRKHKQTKQERILEFIQWHAPPLGIIRVSTLHILLVAEKIALSYQEANIILNNLEYQNKITRRQGLEQEDYIIVKG